MRARVGALGAQELFDLCQHGGAVPFHGSGERLSAGKHRSGMGRAAHLRSSRDPAGKGHGYTRARARPRRRRRASRRAEPPRRCRGLAANRAREALRVPHVSLAATGAVVLDLDTGATIYSRNATLSLLPASNEKLAVTYAALDGARPRLHDRDRRPRRGAASRHHLAGRSRAQGIRRPDPLVRRPDRARPAGARERDHARHRLGRSATSRGSTRGAPLSAGRRRSTSRSRRPSRH